MDEVMDEICEEMVVQGISQLAARGLLVGLEGVDFGEAAAAAHVDVSEALDAWADPGIEGAPEQRFRAAVATRVLQKQPKHGGEELDGGGLTATLIAVATMLETMPNLADASPEVRGYWLRQISRVGAHQNESSIENSQLLRSYIALLAGVGSLSEISPELEQARSEGDVYAAQRYQNLYSRLAETFDLQLRYCYTWEQFTTASVALAQGLIIRVNANPETKAIERFTGLNNEAQEWSLFAVCLEALVNQFFEPVPGKPQTSLQHESKPRRLGGDAG